MLPRENNPGITRVYVIVKYKYDRPQQYVELVTPVNPDYTLNVSVSRVVAETMSPMSQHLH